MNRTLQAFTLIELMITTGILLILVGIATQHYAHALVRSKVARIQTEFRGVATGIETYFVDHNVPPRMSHYSIYEDPIWDTYLGNPVNGVLSQCLTTPVAYLTAVNRIDPFMTNAGFAPIDQQMYTYQVIDVYINRVKTSTFWPQAKSFYGGWRIASVGPDQNFDHNFINSAQLPYDPTNGSVSPGNIWLGQRSSFDATPPVPQLLGYH